MIMRIFSTYWGITVATVGVLSLLGCDSLTIDQGTVNTDEPAAFKCDTDDDCLSSYKCLPAVGESYSVCTSLGSGLSCEQYNLDGDLYLAEDPVPPDGCFGLRGDCDDTDPNTYPGAAELCDGKDNNCDGQIDEGLESVLCARQLGVCAGATTSCVEAELLSCEDPGNDGKSIYARHAEDNGQEYSQVELCDGVDNNCDGVIDEGCCTIDEPLSSSANSNCNCVEDQAFACGKDTGTCTRGVKFCATGDQPAADLACLETVPESTLRPCDPATDTHRVDGNGNLEYCVLEDVGVMEDFHDDCKFSDDPGCERATWRVLADPSTLDSCSADSDCSGEREVCAFDGVCRKENVTPVAEICNGLDDSCNGSVDDHYGSASQAVCGKCPYNMVRGEVKKGSFSEEVCVDIYEAARPDATDSDAGSDETYAVSHGGVMPWTGVNATEAQDACAATELRELVGGLESSSRRTRVVPPKSLCEPAAWEQLCGAQKKEGVSVRDYPYGDTYASGSCNDNNAGGSVLPTGSLQDCVASETLDFFNLSCTSTDNCESVAPFDMIGNVLEWTSLNPRSPLVVNTVLVGGSVHESPAMTCNDAINRGYKTTPSRPQSRWQSLVNTDFGKAKCTTDAECGAGNKCQTVDNSGGLTKRCVIPCATDADCGARGECAEFPVGDGGMLCQIPHSLTGDYEGYDDVGFRCCAGPLSN